MSEADQLRGSLSRIYPVSRETFERLELLVDRLVQWQKKTNLIAPSTQVEIWQRHIADSIQCVSLKYETRRWLDLGSGGGFPGLVIAAFMAGTPDSSVTLVESNNKKASFLRQTARQMGADVTVLAKRIEDVYPVTGQPEMVSARALAELPKLLTLASPWLQKGATAVFHKGRDYRKELSDCDGLWSFDLVIHPSKVSADSVLLEISNLQSLNG